MNDADDHDLVLDIGADLFEVSFQLMRQVRIESLRVDQHTLSRVYEFELVGER